VKDGVRLTALTDKIHDEQHLGYLFIFLLTQTHANAVLLFNNHFYTLFMLVWLARKH